MLWGGRGEREKAGEREGGRKERGRKGKKKRLSSVVLICLWRKPLPLYCVGLGHSLNLLVTGSHTYPPQI